MATKNSKLRGRALARQDKDRALEELEIELDSVEEKPIAKGSQGAVHRASYQGDVVALKKMSLVGITATKRNTVWKSISASGALSHFSTMTWPRWFRRAVRNRHRHAIEQASRRWRGGRRGDSDERTVKF